MHETECNLHSSLALMVLTDDLAHKMSTDAEKAAERKAQAARAKKLVSR